MSGPAAESVNDVIVIGTTGPVVQLARLNGQALALVLVP
jgi:hypothetical protein